MAAQRASTGGPTLSLGLKGLLGGKTTVHVGWVGVGRIGRHPLEFGLFGHRLQGFGVKFHPVPDGDPMASIVPAANSNTKRAGCRDRAAPAWSRIAGAGRSSTPRGGSAFIWQITTGAIITKTDVEVDKAVFHQKARTDRWGKARSCLRCRGVLERRRGLVHARPDRRPIS